MKKFPLFIMVVLLSRYSFAGPDVKMLVDYDRSDLEEAIAAEIKEISQKESLKKYRPPSVTGLRGEDGISKPEYELKRYNNIKTKEKDKEDKKDNRLINKKKLDLFLKRLQDEKLQDLEELKKKGREKEKLRRAKKRFLESLDGNETLDLSKLANRDILDFTIESADELSSASPILHAKDEYPLGVYFGFSLTAMSSSSNGTATLYKKKGNDRQVGFMLKVGYKLVENISIELRTTHGMVNSVITPKFNNSAIYLKPNIYIDSDINFYGLFGFGKSNLSGSSNGIGFSYGAGLKYTTVSNSQLSADIVNYLAKDNSNSMWGYNLGLEFRF